MALILAGCGGSSAPAAESTAAARTVTITHEYGETKIPANPQRIVTAGWIDQDFVLPLGIVPVGTRGGPQLGNALAGKPVEDLSNA